MAHAGAAVTWFLGVSGKIRTLSRTNCTFRDIHSYCGGRKERARQVWRHLPLTTRRAGVGAQLPQPPPRQARPLHISSSPCTAPDMSAQPPPPPQWVLDLNTPPTTKPKTNVADPPGYTASLTRRDRAAASKQSVRKQPTPEEMDTLKMKKAWEVAIAPAKQLPMNAIGMLRPLFLVSWLTVQACT